MAIDDFTEEELKKELERRKKKKTSPPKPKANPDWSQLLQTMASGLEEMIKAEYEDSDLEAYVAEAAWEAVYGTEFWAWKNKSGIHRL